MQFFAAAGRGAGPGFGPGACSAVGMRCPLCCCCGILLMLEGVPRRAEAGMAGVRLMEASRRRLCARPANRNSLVALCRPRREKRRSPPSSLRLACRPSTSGARRL